MGGKKSDITVFEHQCLYVNRGDQRLSPEQLKALQLFYREKDFPFYRLVHNGIRFCEYVGVIQVNSLTIEVLPKADANGPVVWRKLLIDMLRRSGMLNVHAPTNSSMALKSNSLLHLYFELFVQETEAILHRGLTKRYRRVEGNLTVLKGSFHFNKHIQKNLVHHEFFYTRHTTYDRGHTLNRILYKTLKLLQKICDDRSLNSRIGSLLLDFPEMPDILAEETTFSKIQFDRKTEHYRQAINIARLLLLNFHPDVARGQNNVLALLFDMNVLWEGFILKSLKKGLPNDYIVRGRSRKFFWKKDGGYSKKMIPDIIVICPDGRKVVLDTKWKNIGDMNPSDSDLRQMYTYSRFHNDAITALVYPASSSVSELVNGNFYDEASGISITSRQCGVIKLAVKHNISEWQEQLVAFIYQSVLNKKH